MESNNTLNNLENQVNDIIERIDNGSAGDLLKQLIRLSPEEKTAMGNKLDEFLVKLRIVNFLAIHDEEAADIVKNHLLLFFKIDIPFEQRLTARYAFFYGTPEKNVQREMIKKAILENEEQLGNFTIGEWLKKFDKYSEINDTENQNIIDFFSADKEAARLNEMERYVLKSILHTYDSLIADELIDIFDAASLLQNLEKKYGDKNVPLELSSLSGFQLAKVPAGATMPYIHQQWPTVNSGDMSNLENISLDNAIKKYPETGEQLITSQKIELKNFHEPVRPSVKNWLADYVHLLGYEEHDGIERANFLFHTTNARRLSEVDRERLSYILKAFDEKTPINIDPAKRQIIFNFPAKIPARVQQPSNPLINKQFEQKNLAQNTQNNPPDIYENYRIQRPEPGQKLSAGKIFSAPKNSNIQEAKFDFPQKMPFEKEQEPVARGTKPANSDLQPYRITSSSVRRNEDQQPPVNPNNVIDLKNLQ